MSFRIVDAKSIGRVENDNLRSVKHIVALFLIVFAVSVTVFAALDHPDESEASYSYYSDGLIYELNPNDHTAQLTGQDPDNLPELVFIPSYVNDGGVRYAVTSIEEYAFLGCYFMHGLSIPETVTDIGAHAFFELEDFSNLWFEGNNQITSVASNAFDRCYNLSFAANFDKIKFIGSDAFSDTSITSVALGDHIESIGDSAFANCGNIGSVVIGNNLKSIGDKAFYDCSNLTSVNILGPLTSIGAGAFNGCSRLASMNIPDSVQSIDVSAFYACRSLKSITIPDSVTSIGNDAFGVCTSLKSITIGNNVTFSGDPFPSHTFYDSDGETVLQKTAESLRGYPYVGETVKKMIRYAEISITFDANRGSGSMEPQSAFQNIPTSLERNTFTREGYVFTGWNTEPLGGGIAYADGQQVTFGDSITLYAQWNPIAVDTTFVGNYEGSTYSVTIQQTYNKRYVLPDTEPSREGYEFDGWWSQAIGGHEITSRFPVKITSPTTYYAHWQISMFTVSFDVNDPECGTVGRDSISNVQYGSVITVDNNKVTINGEYVQAYPKDPTDKYTFVFDSWQGIPDDMTVRGDLKITAYFDRTINSYTVSFNADGGTPVPSDQSVPYGEKALEPDVPVKPGLRFMGWFYDNKQWDFDSAVTQDILLVAHWVDEYTVTFDVQGHGTAPPSQTVVKGDKVQKPNDPSEAEYIFRGWYRESSCENMWDFYADTVNDSMTLYAKWTEVECRISSDGINWIDCETLDMAIKECSDGWSIRLISPNVRSSFTIDKQVTVIFNGTTFLTSSTALTISSDVTFIGMNQMPLTVSFDQDACLTVDMEFDLTARFADIQYQDGKVFVKGLDTNDIAVAHQGYAAVGTAEGIMLSKVTARPFAVLDRGIFNFYPTLEEALDSRPEQASVYVLDYMPLYESAGTLTYTVNANLNRDVTLATVIRVTDGTYSSFYVDSKEVYNNGKTVPLPAGKDLVTKIYGSIYVSAGNVLSISDVSVSQNIILGGGRTDANENLPVASVHLTEKAPATRLVIGFENLDKWIEKIRTDEGWIYRLTDGCDYEFIVSDLQPLDNLIGIDASGFKADVDLSGFSAKLAASSSMIAYIRTSDTAFIGYSSLDDAISQAKSRISIDNTVYFLYRTTHKEGDQPTLSHNIDTDLLFDGSFRVNTIHQDVDSSGRTSEYTIDGSIATLILTEGRSIRITQDMNLQKLFVDGVLCIEGTSVVNLGGNWGSDRTVVMDLSAHEEGTVLKNAGPVAWDVIKYPEGGYIAEMQGNDLVLEKSKSDGFSALGLMVIGILVSVIAAAGLVWAYHRKTV